DWRPPAAVLLEREGLSGHPAPRREAGEATPRGAVAGAGGGGFGIDYEHNPHRLTDPTGPLLKGSPSGGGHPLPAIAVPEVSPAMGARDHKGPSSDGDGDGLPLIPVIDKRTAKPDAGIVPTLKTDLAHEMGPCVAQGASVGDTEPTL